MIHACRNSKGVRGLWAVSLLFSFLLLMGQAMAQDPERTARYSLPNGMRVVIQENRAAPVVSIQVWVKAGSVTETDKEAGITHLIEHMIFNGTPRRPVGGVAKEIEANGGRINAYTSFDHTVYYVTMASRFFDRGLDVLADALRNSLFDPDELEREKAVVIEEIRMGEDDPSRKLSRLLFRTAYRIHPYGRPIIGEEKTVRSITREDILGYVSRWYRPENMVLVVVGDISLNEARNKIHEAFSPFQGKASIFPSVPKEPPQTETRLAFLQERVKAARLGLAFHIPHVKHPDVHALDCLAMILGEGESSRLYQQVKATKELVHSISAYAYTPLDPGLFIVSAQLDGENLKGAFEETYRILRKVAREGVTEEELERAKINIEKDFIYDKETVQGQARKLGYFEVLFGDIRYEREYLQGVRRVMPEDIRRAAEAYLTSNNLTLAVLAPEGIASDFTQDEMAVLCRRIDEEVLGKESRKASTEGRRGIVKRVLANGITVLIREDRSVPLVALHAVFLGGLRFETPETNGIGNFLAQMFTKGTERRKALPLAVEIESMAGEISGFSGRNSFGLSGRFLSRFLPKGMELFSEVLRRPALDPEEIEKARRLILAAIRKQEDDLSRFAFLNFTRALYRKHPYGMNSLGTRESISAITREDLLGHYRRYVVPGNMVLCVVGDVDPDQALSLIEAHFGDFSGPPFHPPAIPEEPPLEGKREVTVPLEKKQVHIVLGFPGTTLFSEDRYPLEVLDAILSGQSGRLFLALRDQEGLAYAVDSFSQPGYDPGYFGIYMGTSPEKVPQALEGIWREIRRVLDKGVTEEETERARAYLVGNFEIGLQTYSSQAMTMALDERYGLGYEDHRDYPRRILSVTPEAVQRVARKYLHQDRFVLVIVGPAETKR